VNINFGGQALEWFDGRHLEAEWRLGDGQCRYCCRDYQ
jgi:hypothetical protein